MTDTMMDLIEDQYVRLLRDMKEDGLTEPEDDGKQETERVSGSSSTMTIAERVKVLSSATDFLLLKQKLQPEKKTSGLDQLRAELNPAKTATRRGRRTAEPAT